MLEVVISKQFSRQFRKLDPHLQEEIVEKLELFKDTANHGALKVHKLSGRLSGKYSFSVNYKIRVIFSYPIPTEAFLLLVGDHNLYK